MKCPASSRVVALGALLAFLGGCTDSPFELPTDGSALRASSIRPTTPTAVHAPPGSWLTAPEVVVQDQLGNPVINVPVRFTVLSAGGFVSNRVFATDAEGRATAGHWALGAEPGENLVVAEVEGPTPAAFMAIGDLEPIRAAYGLVRLGYRPVPVPGSFIGGYYFLYESGKFRQGYVSGGGEKPVASSVRIGEYSQADSAITFREGSRVPWGGFLGGDSLFIQDFWERDAEVYALTPAAQPPSQFPLVSRPATVYNRLAPHSHPTGAVSRYVLYHDGTSGLQYMRSTQAAVVISEYPGRYSRTDSVITFHFDGDPRWQATGTVRGDRLIVEYNIIMSLTDFEDGEYVCAPGKPAG